MQYPYYYGTICLQIRNKGQVDTRFGIEGEREPCVEGQRTNG